MPRSCCRLLPGSEVHCRCFTALHLFSAKPLLLAAQLGGGGGAGQEGKGPSPACALPRRPLLLTIEGLAWPHRIGTPSAIRERETFPVSVP